MSKQILSSENALKAAQETRERRARELKAEMEPDIGFVTDAINHAMLNSDTDNRGYWHIRIRRRDIKYENWKAVIKEAVQILREQNYYVDEPKPKSAFFDKNTSYVISFKAGGLLGEASNV